ncbi:type III-B CRISPR module RAMP protein Cmr4 [Candidatus Chloroploca sp. M-50]|uniref:Type III-B CRISPR module RAMP protein Cmr4 n=1 Tax=Candidatus Chloroploca mongolica TaxID=2528176 RepID=A0ABS4DG87_9CHLR|nr:type III-B CRISPR module RAMP protein Cmr4 [Candidatus Chloroploca mongolica]MBP1468456.1 type III-B CRISPR module RAMP protein Cmr4 [Candidatus Chloroploca mongolica]
MPDTSSVSVVLLHALSPLHAGTGQGIGVIDLPIAREKATGLPFLPGSSFKGTLRDWCETQKDKPACEKVFGPPTERADEHAGAAQFADLRLLLLPVRSFRGTFAWVTSPYLLRRFAREAREAGLPALPTVIPEPADAAPTAQADAAEALVTATSTLGLQQGNATYVYLEDLDLAFKDDAQATLWASWLGQQLFPNGGDHAAWQTMLQERFCLVHDNIMSFLLETALEITARVRLEDTSKTVAQGGLWYEEALPAETVLTGLVLASPISASGATTQDVEAILHDASRSTHQFGGKATVGRGLCRFTVARKGKA